jgi:hypothetical protein
MMRYLVLGWLLVCQMAFALDTSELAQSRFGQLQVKMGAEGKRELRLADQLLYQDVGYFGMSQVLQLGDADVILVKKTPATALPNEFFFITLNQGVQPILSESFLTGDRPARPVIQDDKIVVNLGLNAGNLEVVTYQAGKITLQKTPIVGKKAKAEYCDYLYKQIYLPYIDGKQCEAAPEAAVFGEGESPAEVYRRMMDNDPRLNETQFQTLAKSACKSGKSVRYTVFKKQVCGG